MLKKTVIILIALVLLFTPGCQQQKPQPSAQPDTPPATGEPAPGKTGEEPPTKPPAKEVSAGDMREAKELVKEAKKLRYDKKYKDAMLKCGEALEKNPKEMDAYEEMASIHKGQNDFSKAVEIYEKAIELDPENPKLWMSKGSTLRFQHKYDDSIKAFKKAIELKPNDRRIYVELANTYRDNKDYANAEKTFEETINKFSDDYSMPGYYASYWSYRAFGERDKEKSAEFFQKSADNYEISFKKMTDKNKFNKPSTLYSWGDVYYQKWKKTGNEDDKKKALEKFDEYKKEKPDHVWMDSANKKIAEMKK